MKQLLKDIIIDQKSFLPSKKTIIRSFSEKYLNNEEIIIISGVRRCGKSVLLQQIRDRLPQKDYFFNFDDDRLGNFTIENFQQLYEVFIELYENKIISILMKYRILQDGSILPSDCIIQEKRFL